MGKRIKKTISITVSDDVIKLIDDNIPTGVSKSEFITSLIKKGIMGSDTYSYDTVMNAHEDMEKLFAVVKSLYKYRKNLQK